MASALDGSDGNLHSRLAVASKTADEEVLTLHELDLIFSSLIHFGTSWGFARTIPCFVHSNHVVSCRAVVEHCKMTF